MIVIGCAAVATAALAVNFPSGATDIASNGTDGWNGTMPDSNTKARFGNAGFFTASADVHFGDFEICGNPTTFTMNPNGVTRTAKVASLYMGWYDRSTTLHGGIWNLQGLGRFAACNEYGTYNTTVTLDQGCVVTNAATLWLGYKTRNNTIKITDASRVYANGGTLNWDSTGVNALLEVSSGGQLHIINGNFVDGGGTSPSALIEADTTNRIVVTGSGSKIVCPASISGNNKLGFIIGTAFGRNSLDVSDHGEVYAPFRLGVGFSNLANNNRAVFRDNAKYYISILQIGEYGSHGNALEILSGAEGSFSTAYVGGNNRASCNNRLVLSNATLQCRQVLVSSVAGSESNSFDIIGADTDFSVTVTDVPRYPFIDKGVRNRFTLDGASWNYWLNMEFEHAGSSNVIAFVNGAQMTAGGGYFSGTNDTASCGNRIYVTSGALLSGKFYSITRADNVMIVSNATVEANESASGQGTINFGTLLLNVDEAGINGNGLVLGGTTPRVQAANDISFLRGSFLKVEMPPEGYATDYAPVTAKTLVFDETSKIEASGVAALQETLETSTIYTVASTTDGITIPDTVIAAANAELADIRANFVLTNNGKDLALRVSAPFKGTQLTIR